MEVVSHPSKLNDCSLGDVYYGYLVPTVICGRTLSIKGDVTKFLTSWCEHTLEGDINKLIKEHPDLGLESFGVAFKDRMFSKLLVVSPRENPNDAWQIVWGVWSDVFKNGAEDRTADWALYFRVSCVFLMFYLYHSQSGPQNLPIPISLDTFQSCLALSHDVLSLFKVTSVFNVLNYMLVHKCFTFASYDGVQYLHQSKFGRPLKVVIGPPGSGKSTYCAAMQHKLNSMNRNCIIVNLDPQVTLAELPYEPTIDVCNLIDSERVSKTFNLGPNATLLYCMEYLLENLDWLLEEVSRNKDSYLLYDLPGQVELFVHHNALKDIVAKLEKANQRLVQVNLIDSTLCTDPFKYVAALLSSLSSQIFMQLPHINVLSKMRLLRMAREDLAYRLEYYTQAQDLQQLMIVLRNGLLLPNSQKFERFTSTLCEVIEDFGLLSFRTMDVEDADSVEEVLSNADRALGYIPFNDGDFYCNFESDVWRDVAGLEDRFAGPEE